MMEIQWIQTAAVKCLEQKPVLSVLGVCEEKLALQRLVNTLSASSVFWNGLRLVDLKMKVD